MTQPPPTQTAMSIALSMARGCYQRAIIAGSARLSGADLKGRADRAFVNVEGFVELQHWARWAIPLRWRWFIVDDWIAPSRGIRVRWAIIRSMARPCPVWALKSRARQRALSVGAGGDAE